MSTNEAIEINKIENEEENKTPDKKQIEAEEKEVMLKTEPENIEAVSEQKSAENEGPVKTALSTEFTEQQGREVKPKFIPIGGIKMPGFFTRNSDKDKSKDEDGVEKDGEEKEEGAKPRHRLQFLHTCPFTQFLHRPQAKAEGDNEGAETAETDPAAPTETTANKTRFRLPNLPQIKYPKIFQKKAEKDPEVTLASMETLEDKVDLQNDGMETVKLDGDEADGKVATKLPLKERIRQKKFIIDDIIVCAVVILVVLAVIIGIIIGARAGPPAVRPLRLGRYMVTLTSCGPVEGELKDGVYNFYNIPYAAPPVGALRFANAQPLNNLSLCWNGTRPAAAAARGPPCLQRLANGSVAGDEACLALDVMTPHVRYDSPLPVVVLVGAASLAGGDGAGGPLEPSALYSRTKEVVFVKPNFRLGAFGFLALDILSKSKYPPTSGNYGLSDLLVALEWIKNNIKYFGGDPASVTLLGHRAGATLVAALTTVKKAHKLYSRVWLSSPSVIFPGDPLETTEKENEQFKMISKCTDADCLRRISSTEILTATPDYWLGSTAHSLPQRDELKHSWLALDGELLRQHPYEAWAARAAAGKDARPMVFGTTLHAAHSDLLHSTHLNWTAELVERLVGDSELGRRNLSAALFQHFDKSYRGLVELVTAVRTLCPLVGAARLRLRAPLYVARGGGAGLAGPDADVRAILGTFDSDEPEQRRYMAAVQLQFYYYVWHGRLPGAGAGAGAGGAGGEPPLLALAQDALPLGELPACDLLIREDIVPRYAHVD